MTNVNNESDSGIFWCSVLEAEILGETDLWRFYWSALATVRAALQKNRFLNSSRTSKRIRSEFNGPKEELHHERLENCIKIVKL